MYNKLMIAAYLALLTCPFISIFAAAPILIIRYSKTKTVNVVRCTNLYLLFFFSLCALFLTMLPFPSFSEVAGMTSRFVQLVPFYCFYDFFENSGLIISDWKTVIPAFGSGIMFGIIANVAMLIPSGFFFRRVFPEVKTGMVVLTGFLMSLFFEITQLSGVFFVYPRPYRIFDVDDLIQNTFGFFLGAHFAHAWRLLKSPTNLEVRQGGEVSFRRRFFASLVDQGILNLIILLSVFISKKAIRFFVVRPLKSFPVYFAYIMVLNLLLAVITYLNDGKTLGMHLFGLRLTSIKGERISLVQCLIRDGIKGLLLNLPLLIWWFIVLSRDRHIVFSILCTFMAAELVLSYVFFVLTVALHIVTHGEKLIYEKVSGTHLGLEVETVIKNRQKVLYRGKLIPEMIDPGSDAIYNILREHSIDEKHCLKMKYMVEAALDTWMNNGLKGNVFTVQIDMRPRMNTLLVCAHGDYVFVEHDEVIELETKHGMKLKYDTYYTGGINVFAVEL